MLYTIMFAKIFNVIKLFYLGLTSEDGYLAWDVKTSPLQLYADGKSWQTICYEGIDMTVAHVVCRQQGKISATALKEATEQ